MTTVLGSTVAPELPPDPRLAALRAELGDVVRTDDAALNAARADRSGQVSQSRPLAVVEATTVEQVQATMRFATAHQLPVVPRGAGTGATASTTSAPRVAANERLQPPR